MFDEVALKIVLAVAAAMKHAHERGLIHRDIKPENVILTKDGQVKLADLGLARLTADEKWACRGGHGHRHAYYLSPEQSGAGRRRYPGGHLQPGRPTLYHMVTGRVPYPGGTGRGDAEARRQECPAHPTPDHVNTRLSSGLGVVVETMMAKNRDSRYRNPDDLILDLKCLLQGEEAR